MEAKLKLGNRVLELRESLGMTQKNLAFAANLDRSYIAGIERGKRNVSIVNIEKICKALGRSMHSFFDHEYFK
jgi:transcriptional regulator with XRE-family HTH domain